MLKSCTYVLPSTTSSAAVACVARIGAPGPCWFAGRPEIDHPLLLCMPFPHGVPQWLEDFQALVSVALDQGSSQLDRVSAVGDLYEMACRERRLGSPRSELVVQVARLVSAELWSPMLLVVLTHALLDLSNFELSYAVDPRSAGAAHLRDSKGRRLVGGKFMHLELRDMWQDVAKRLEGLSSGELEQMGDHEAMAALTLLGLFMAHGSVSNRMQPNAEEQWRYARSSGRSLWDCLLRGISDEARRTTREFEAQFGWPARQRHSSCPLQRQT